jgi:hypothetical protein
VRNYHFNSEQQIFFPSVLLRLPSDIESMSDPSMKRRHCSCGPFSIHGLRELALSMLPEHTQEHTMCLRLKHATIGDDVKASANSSGCEVGVLIEEVMRDLEGVMFGKSEMLETRGSG